MRQPEFSEIVDEIKEELGLHGQTDATESLIKSAVNEAVDEAESIIHENAMDYYRKETTLTVAEGDEELDLPSDMFGVRIRDFWYDNGTDRYKIEKILAKDIPYVIDSDNYRYTLTHETDGFKVKIYPAIRAEDHDSEYFKLWYIRNANRYEESSDKCDIPENAAYVKTHAKLNLLTYFPQPLIYAHCQAKIQDYRERLIATTSTLAADGEDNILRPDATFYYDAE